ncbi:MAG TPA: DUF4279 domain-containing protein [Candidatus Sulfotelmatobacter sp.]|nr:DUF4279 domain-containing protein [Candidatus Sulfotelmatobacter sp.]
MSANAEFIVLTREMSAAQISELLGFPADRSYSEGDPGMSMTTGLEVGRKRKTRWALSSEARVTSSELEDHLRVLLEITLPRADIIRNLAKTSNVFFWVFWDSDSLDRGDGPILSSEICSGIGALVLTCNLMSIARLTTKTASSIGEKIVEIACCA